LSREEIYRLFDEHRSKALKAVEEVHECVVAMCKGDHESLLDHARNIIQLEREDDDLIETLEEELFKGASLQYSIEDYFRLTEVIERVLDRVEILARYMTVQSLNIPPIMVEGTIALSKTLLDASRELEKAVVVLPESFDEAMNKTRQVRSLRDTIVAQEFELLQKLFSTETDPKTGSLLKDVISLIARTAESLLNTSNAVRTLVFKYRI